MDTKEKEYLAKLMAKELIKHFEGLRITPYLCPGGYLTVGWGHKILPGEPIREITIADAHFLLNSDVDKVLAAINACLPEEAYGRLNENQLAALISFVFNIGPTAFSVSKMRKKLIEKRPAEEVAREFDNWVYAKGEKLPGLVERRKAEKELFLSTGKKKQ